MFSRFIPKLLIGTAVAVLSSAVWADEAHLAKQVYITKQLGFEARNCLIFDPSPCDPKLANEVTSFSFELAKRAMTGSLLLGYSEEGVTNRRSILVGARLHWPDLAPQLSFAAALGSRDNDTTDLIPADLRSSLGFNYQRGRLGIGLGMDSSLTANTDDSSVHLKLNYTLGR